MRSEPNPDDAGTAAAGEEPWYELVAALLGQFAGSQTGHRVSLAQRWGIGWAWAIPPLTVLLGFTGLCLMFAPLWISIGVGGFSPS